MNVPNTEEIASERLHPLTVNISGDAELLVAGLPTDQERERARILKGIHDQISPQLLSAVFLTQILKEKLEAKELEESVMAAELSEALIKMIDGLWRFWIHLVRLHLPLNLYHFAAATGLAFTGFPNAFSITSAATSKPQVSRRTFWNQRALLR
jgi:hypothetical protein